MTFGHAETALSPQNSIVVVTENAISSAATVISSLMDMVRIYFTFVAIQVNEVMADLAFDQSAELNIEESWREAMKKLLRSRRPILQQLTWKLSSKLTRMEVGL